MNKNTHIKTMRKTKRKTSKKPEKYTTQNKKQVQAMV